MLTTADIARDLGVCTVTVERWIREGTLKATKQSNRIGYRITEEDYEAFVEANARYKCIREGIVFSHKEKKARESLCDVLDTKILSFKNALKEENRDERYLSGYERALRDIQGVINRERIRKSEQDVA